jgi:hypothetical protein
VAVALQRCPHTLGYFDDTGEPGWGYDGHAEVVGGR